MPVTPNYIPGKALSGSFNGTDLTITKSSMKVMVNVLKGTNKKSNGQQEVFAGIRSASGTLTFVINADSPVVAAEGTFITLIVGVTGGRSYNGTFFIDSISDEATVDGDYSMTVSVQSSGAFTAA